MSEIIYKANLKPCEAVKSKNFYAYTTVDLVLFDIVIIANWVLKFE